MFFGLISPTALADFVTFVESTGNGAPIVFAVSFALATVACLPSSLIEIISGFLFPFPVALAVNVSAKVSGAILAFLLGKTVCNDCVSKQAEKVQVLRALRVAMKKESSAFKLAVLLRFSPAPIFVKNYGLGALELSLPNFVGATILSALPMGCVWVMLGGAAREAGGGILDIVSDDQPSGLSALPPHIKYPLLAVGLALMAYFGYYVKRTLGEIIAAEQEGSSPEVASTKEEGVGRGKSKTS